MLAKDIMTKETIKINPQTSVIKAIDLLLENRISGLPVVDDDLHLVGVLSEKDLLGILFEKNIDVDAPVERYMTQKVIRFDEKDNVADICEVFLKQNIRRVPIVEDGRLVGIISRRDVLRMILATVLDLKESRRPT